jgi:hypothetical protein
MKLFYTFGRARGLLAKAKSIALELQEKPLLQKIELLEKEVADKNRHMRNYVTEMGLDMP